VQQKTEAMTVQTANKRTNKQQTDTRKTQKGTNMRANPDEERSSLKVCALLNAEGYKYMMECK